MQFVRPFLFHEAVERIGIKSPIGSKLNSAEWADVPVELRARAFFSSEVENVRFLQRARDGIQDFLTASRDESGALAMDRQRFVTLMSEFAMKEGLGPLDPNDAHTLKDITSQRRLELVFDTNVRQAQDYGNWKQGMDPDVLDAFPAQRFIRVQDVSEPRDWHTQFENGVWLKTDLAAWARINRDFGTPYGPWGCGCGHDVEDVSREEAEALGLIRSNQQVTPPDVKFNDTAKASIKHLDPDLRNTLIERLAEEAEYDEAEQTLRWKKRKPEVTP